MLQQDDMTALRASDESVINVEQVEKAGTAWA